MYLLYTIEDVNSSHEGRHRIDKINGSENMSALDIPAGERDNELQTPGTDLRSPIKQLNCTWLPGRDDLPQWHQLV